LYLPLAGQGSQALSQGRAGNHVEQLWRRELVCSSSLTSICTGPKLMPAMALVVGLLFADRLRRSVPALLHIGNGVDRFRNRGVRRTHPSAARWQSSWPRPPSGLGQSWPCIAPFSQR
jgi:hypothetical protein